MGTKKLLPDRRCAFCGKLFVPKKKTRMLCSRLCAKSRIYVQVTRLQGK